MAVDLGYAMTLKPDAAIRYFRSKGFKLAFNLSEMKDRAHTTSFVVSGITKQDVLADVHGLLAQSLENGQTGEWYKDNLLPQLARKGWLGKGLKADENGELEGRKLMPYRLDTIYRTNTQSAYMAGRYQKMRENVAARPYWQYVAVMDSRTRPAHAALNGRIFRWDDPIWDIIFPPNGYNCRCRVVALSQAEVDRHPVGVESSEGLMVTVQQPYGNTTRPVKGYRDPKTGRVFTPDVGFHLNHGQDALAALGQSLLAKAVDVSPALAAQAVDEVMRMPVVRAEFTRDTAWWVQQVHADRTLRGDWRNIGALLPAVLDELTQPPVSAVIQLQAAVVQAVAEPGTEWQMLPALLASPEVVLRDTDDSLVYVISGGHWPRMLRVSLSGPVPQVAASSALTAADITHLKQLTVVTGEWRS